MITACRIGKFSAILEAKTAQIDQIDTSAAVSCPIILPDCVTVIAALPGRSLTQQNTSKAESLRQAPLKLLKNPNYQHPFYWSPFILIGNWL